MSDETVAPDPAKDKAAAMKVLTDERAKRLERFQALTAAAIKETGFAFSAEPLASIGPDGLVRYGARVVIVEAPDA